MKKLKPALELISVKMVRQTLAIKQESKPTLTT